MTGLEESWRGHVILDTDPKYSIQFTHDATDGARLRPSQTSF